MSVETTATAAEQSAALAALTIGQPEPTVAQPVEPTGRDVYAGGDVRRLLIGPAHLVWPEGGTLHYATDVEVGDTVLVSAQQAARLDRIGVTVDETTDLTRTALEKAAGLATDEQLAAMRAPELVAYVAQHPDERTRVRDLEEQRPAPRKTVLTATDTTPEEDDAAEERRQQLADAAEDAEDVEQERALADARRQESEALLVSGTPAEGDPVTDVPTATGFARLSPELNQPGPLNLP